MKIRLYEKGDEQEIKQLIEASLKEVFNAPATNLEDLDDVKANFEKFWVLENKSEIIGTLGVKKEGWDARISRMYVKKSERGKGIGKHLMEKALAYCDKHKFTRIILTTFKRMNSKGFYEKMGFREFDFETDTGRFWMEYQK